MPVKLAIVIDDIGYRTKEDSAIYALPKEVSVAIIPNAPYATERAKKAFLQKRDILIHLPMQPKDKSKPIEADVLMVNDSQDEINQLIRTARR